MTIEELDKETTEKQEGVKELRFYKDEEGHKVEGYCLSRGIDDVNDVITSVAFDTMVNGALLNPALFTDPNYKPIGKIIKFDLDEKGLWVVALLMEGIESSNVDEWDKHIKCQFVTRIKTYDTEKEFIPRINKTVNFIQKFELLSVSLIPIPKEA